MSEDARAGSDSGLDGAPLLRLLWWLVGLGLSARLLRYALRFPLWEDECFLMQNVAERGFEGLAQPLDRHQVAPVLFLWATELTSRVLGFHELALRLLPLLCAVGAVLLFWRVAARLLVDPAARLIGVGVMAVAYPGIRYAAEAKQYSVDLLASVVLLSLVVEWMKGGGRRWLWALALATPVAIGSSYPAVFVAGGLWLAVGWEVLRAGDERRGGDVVPWLLQGLLTCAAFGVVYWLVGRHQAEAELGMMRDHWTRGGAFPPYDAGALLWLLQVHCSELVAWPAGGARFASTGTALLVLAGLVHAWRERRALLVLLLPPFALNLVAAALHRYPYGGHVKFSQHLGPAICLLAGLGAASLIGWVGRRWGPTSARRVCLGLTVALGAVAVGSMVRDAVNPHKTESDARIRGFARYWWFPAEGSPLPRAQTRDALVDFGVDGSPETSAELSWEAMWRVNRHIYGPSPGEPDWDAISAERPLRVTVYRDRRYAWDPAPLEAWLTTMRARGLRMRSRERLVFPRYDKKERPMPVVDVCEVLTFVPADAEGATGR